MNWHTHVVWAATCRNFLSQHFTCKNSLELNSYMQNGSEFEEAKTWVGRDATSKKKDTASREDRQFTVHERYQWGGKSHWVDFLKFIVVKEKKIIFGLACKMREVLCHEKIQQRLLAETFQILEKDRTTALSQARIHGFCVTTHQQPCSPNWGCR